MVESGVGWTFPAISPGVPRKFPPRVEPEPRRSRPDSSSLAKIRSGDAMGHAVSGRTVDGDSGSEFGGSGFGVW